MEQITKIIYARWVCERLLEMGFRPIETIDNPIKPEFKCWVFARTTDFEQALGEILGKGDGRNGVC